jgi:hypothetical protein
MKNNSLSPLFITGLWRSGTTLISRMLNNHDEISVTYDLVHFLRFSYNKYNPINVESSALQLVKDVADRINDRYQIKFSIDEVMADIGGLYDYSVIYNSIMSNLLLKDTTKRVWGEKTNVAWREIPYFLNMYPNGRVINIIRDPRAVLYSWKNFTNASGNDYLDSILNSYDAMLKAGEYNENYKNKRYITVIYEDLVKDPRKTMHEVCNKLKIEYSENMLDQTKFKDMHGANWKSNSIEGKAPSGIYKNALNKWKDGLEEWEIALCEKMTGSLFKDFDYVESLETYNESITNNMISEIKKSSLASDGLIRFLLTGESFERYPSDPTNKENW